MANDGFGANSGMRYHCSKAHLGSDHAGDKVATVDGLTVKEYGFGRMRTTEFTFTDVELALTDEPSTVAYGGLKIYDFPQGYIYFQSGCMDLALTKDSAGVDDDWNGDIGVGTATAGNDGTLSSTEQNVIPTTATPTASSGVTTGDCVSTATEHAIVDGTSTALDLYVNILVDDADHDVTTTPCNLILNGTLVVVWLSMGDN